MSKHIIYLLIALVFSGLGNVQAQHRIDSRMTSQKFAALIYFIESFYVDTVDAGKLTEDAIVAMLKELDPHSAYISKDDLAAANEQLVGSFEGIGVTYQILRDTILVVSPVVGGPSEKVGIMSGDRIIKIDGEDAFGKKINNKYVTSHLRGEKGSKVTLGIKRGNSPELIEFTVVRDKIPLYSVDASFMLNKEVGYVKLNQFAQKSITEFEDALKKLRGQRMKSLVLDLRGNSGGYLNIATMLADEFLPEGKMLVYTEGTRSRREEFKSSKSGQFTEGKLVILIDEGSASASEIVSGAVQDWDRGIVIGRRSFGKGLVQRPFDMPDGSQVRLTTARYYTPTGRCIQRSYAEGVEDYHKDILKRLEHGELYHSDSIHFPDSLKYTTPNGRVVYGGGGIMPDVFVPVDTTNYSNLYSNLVRKGVFNRFSLDYVLKNREKIVGKYPTFNKFDNKFTVNAQMMDDFVKLAEKEGVKWDKEQFEASEEFIRMQIKALIARDVWSNEQYYQVVLKNDNVVLKALELLDSNQKYNDILKGGQKR